MKPKVYIETTIVSYLVARPSRDLVLAARQQITQEWWESQRNKFDLYISDAVVAEASEGDEDVARRRVEALKDVPVLRPNADAKNLATYLLKRGAIPESYPDDAIHIAMSAVNGIDYLLTWNYAHMVNVNAEYLLRKYVKKKDMKLL
jgi:predicted nucleic acid-binding protein